MDFFFLILFIFSAIGYSFVDEVVEETTKFLPYFLYLGFRGNDGLRENLKLEYKTPYVRMIKYEPILNMRGNCF